jgi:hypothetical protein
VDGDEREKKPKNSKKKSHNNNDKKSTESNKQERSPNDKSNNAHNNIYHEIRKKIFGALQNVYLFFLEPLPWCEPCHKHIRNREKMIDEPEIIPPNMQNINKCTAIVPYQIISGDQKDTHKNSIAGIRE